MLDRYTMKLLLQQANVPTPDFALIESATRTLEPVQVQVPLSVRPRFEPDQARTVKSQEQLERAVHEIQRSFDQPAIVETRLSGPEYRVCLLGNGNPQALPIVATDAKGRGKQCPAPIDAALHERLRHYAIRAYTALGCRDYARVDLRLSESGEPQVVGVHSAGVLARRGAFAVAAKQAGYAFDELLLNIIAIAWSRYGAPIPASAETENQAAAAYTGAPAPANAS